MCERATLRRLKFNILISGKISHEKGFRTGKPGCLFDFLSNAKKGTMGRHTSQISLSAGGQNYKFQSSYLLHCQTWKRKINWSISKCNLKCLLLVVDYLLKLDKTFSSIPGTSIKVILSNTPDWLNFQESFTGVVWTLNWFVSLQIILFLSGCYS